MHNIFSSLTLLRVPQEMEQVTWKVKQTNKQYPSCLLNLIVLCVVETPDFRFDLKKIGCFKPHCHMISL